MHARNLFWQLYPPYLAVTLLSLLVLAVYAAIELRESYHESTAEMLQTRARYLEPMMRDLLAAGETGKVDSVCKQFGGIGSTRITVILPSGLVAGDSDEDPAQMNNHADRPEVMAVLKGEPGTALRYSHTLQKEMMYFTLLLERDGNRLGSPSDSDAGDSDQRRAREALLEGRAWNSIGADGYVCALTS